MSLAQTAIALPLAFIGLQIISQTEHKQNTNILALSMFLY